MFIILSFMVAYIQSVYATQQWSIDISQTSKQYFANWWSKGCGSGHGSLALRDDWRNLMLKAHEELGFEYVRFHGILDDDVGSVNGVNDYSFVNIDNIFDFLTSINMKPYVEISFMPKDFASNTSCTIMHYNGIVTPPKNYTIWNSFIQTWIQHIVDRYGIEEVSTWYFEVWNEPNGQFYRTSKCGQSTLNLYLELYKSTVYAIKSVNSKLRVGGPATAGLKWLSDFLNATINSNIPLDFLASHQYPKNATAAQYNQYGSNYYYEEINIVNDIINSFPKYSNNLEFVLSEFNSGLYQHKIGYNNPDSEYSSSFIIFQMLKLQGLFHGVNPKNHYSFMSWWTFSDIFEEDGFWSAPFWDVNGAENKQNPNNQNRYFGITTKRGINKPVWHAFQLANQMGSNISYHAYNDKQNNIKNTIAIFCLKNTYLASNKNRYSIFISNWNYLGYPIINQTIEITVNQLIDNGLLNPKTAQIYRVDKINANAYTKWNEIGKPTYPTTQQLQILNSSAQIKPESMNLQNINSTSVTFNVTIPVYGFVMVDIQY
eukprot:121318_1